MVVLGFKREQLRHRYDVGFISEDAWHNYSGQKTAEILARHVPHRVRCKTFLLNAGSGSYTAASEPWMEVPLDLFTTPLVGRPRAVCGSVEQLPFKSGMFDAIICVGEVLGYCDPSHAFREFGRTLKPGGLLICDFASSRCARYWFKPTYGRPADLVSDKYNETPERIWVYDPSYISSLLHCFGFRIEACLGTHAWASVAQRFGATRPAAISIERLLQFLPQPTIWAYLMTFVAVRNEAAP